MLDTLLRYESTLHYWFPWKKYNYKQCFLCQFLDNIHLIYWMTLTCTYRCNVLWVVDIYKFSSRTDLTNANPQFKNLLESTGWINQRPLVPNNPCDMQSQLAKNSIHPLPSWSLSEGGREHIYITSNLPTSVEILKMTLAIKVTEKK